MRGCLNFAMEYKISGVTAQHSFPPHNLFTYDNEPDTHGGQMVRMDAGDVRMLGTFNQEVPMILLNNQWCYSSVENSYHP